MMEKKIFKPLNQTFARRIGKSLSFFKKDLLKNELPKYLYTTEFFEANKKQKVFLEIGFGMGEHLINQLKLNHVDLFIGVEVFINGVANFLKHAKDNQYTNFLIWPDDLDLMLKSIPNSSLDGIYILFPDPWPKRRYLKKRLFNRERFLDFKAKLKVGGFIIFASDVEDYFVSSCIVFKNDPDFIIESNDFLKYPIGYVRTKYHQKAINEGRNAWFVKVILK